MEKDLYALADRANRIYKDRLFYVGYNDTDDCEQIFVVDDSEYAKVMKAVDAKFL